VTNLSCISIAVMLACAVAAAQESDPKLKSKVKVEDGKTLTVTGCVERGSDRQYVLTNVAGKDGALGSYILAATDDNDLEDISKHVGHRVEVTGMAADQGKGKIKVETKVEGTTGKTENKSEVKGDLNGLPFMGVKTLRMIASVCP
jgi:hypothetical protein